MLLHKLRIRIMFLWRGVYHLQLHTRSSCIQKSWDINVELFCQREEDNPNDLYVVAVKTDGIVVGHVPRKHLAGCSLFLRRRSTIVCKITGSRRLV